LDRYINAELLGIGKNSDSKVIPNAASNQTTKITKELISIPPPEVIVGEKKLVCVTAIKSSNQFYVQMTNHINEIAELQKQLHVTYENYNVSEGCIRNIRTGDICCTRYVDGELRLELLLNQNSCLYPIIQHLYICPILDLLCHANPTEKYYHVLRLSILIYLV
jgi:hypothetical protein